MNEKRYPRIVKGDENVRASGEIMSFDVKTDRVGLRVSIFERKQTSKKMKKKMKKKTS